MNNPKTIFDEILPWATSYDGLPPEMALDSDYQSAFALMQLIVHGHRSPHTRLAAIKEYNERVWGKSKTDTKLLSSEHLDLTKLSEGELLTLLTLLEKAEKVDKEEHIHEQVQKI